MQAIQIHEISCFCLVLYLTCFLYLAFDLQDILVCPPFPPPYVFAHLIFCLCTLSSI